MAAISIMMTQCIMLREVKATESLESLASWLSLGYHICCLRLLFTYILQKIIISEKLFIIFLINLFFRYLNRNKHSHTKNKKKLITICLRFCLFVFFSIKQNNLKQLSNNTTKTHPKTRFFHANMKTLNFLSCKGL